MAPLSEFEVKRDVSMGELVEKSSATLPRPSRIEIDPSIHLTIWASAQTREANNEGS
jgi:hypothetical protein